MAKKRTSYEAYKDWYEKKVHEHKERVKGTNNWQKQNLEKYYDEMYTEEEYAKQAAKAHRKGIKNIARTIAYSQELTGEKFRHQYRERYNKELGDMRDKAAREDVFLDYYAEMSAEGYSHDQIEQMFKEYFY